MASSPAIVGLVSYGAGNLQSLANALEYLGAEVRLVTREADLEDAVTHLVLPGVGAFGYCATQLRASGLLPPVADWALRQKRPILGICVGMQLLADSSDEQGLQEGLGWIGGEVRRFAPPATEIRVPHVGWNDVTFAHEFGRFRVGDKADFYFDHSYAYLDGGRGDLLASCMHGQRFCAAIRRDNIVAAQFHPEKSQTAGRRFLEAFLQIQPC